MICSIVQMVYVKSSTSFIISSFSSEKMAMVANSLYRLYKLALELKYCMYNEVSNSGCESFPMSLYDYIIYIVLKSNIMFTGVHLRNIIVITHNCGHAWRGRYWTLCFAAAFHFKQCFVPDILPFYWCCVSRVLVYTNTSTERKWSERVNTTQQFWLFLIK